MDLVKKHDLEKFSENLWNSFCENPDLEPGTWLHLLNIFFSSKSLNKFSAYTDPIINDLFTLSKIENLVIFLKKGGCRAKSIVKVCIESIERLGFSRTNIQILVLNPSRAGISLIFFSPKTEDSSDPVKIIHFPRGRIPIYFQELIRTRSVQKSSPLELLQVLFDVPALEVDFLLYLKERIKISDVELRIRIISYLSLLLIFSRFILIDDFLDWLSWEFQNFKQTTLKNCITRLQEFNTQQIIKNDSITELGIIIKELGLCTFPIDIVVFQDLLQRYPYSFNEPTAFIQEIAISPSIFSEVTENLLISSPKNKKKGKYYTSAINADFISHLAVYRLLSNKLTGISSDELFSWVYDDWGLEGEKPLNMSLDQFLTNSSSLKILDPACGTGTFLLSISRLLYRLATSWSISQNKRFPIVELFGIEPDKIAVLVTRIRLMFFKIQELSKVSSGNSRKGKKFPVRWKSHNIIQGDFFNHKKICNMNFDLVLGNPPWVRHEDIGVDQAPDYKELIQTQIRELCNKSLHFDRKSDLYIYFCLMGLYLLENKGVLAFLTSNAWLEVKYGQTLQNFLLDPDKHVVNFDIIHRSGKRLWNRLGINSIILIAEKSSNDQAILSSGTFTETLVNFPQIPLSSLKKGLILSSNYEDQFYRTEQIPRDLLKKTHKWAGTFLRMSHSERKLIQRIVKKGVPLAYLADVRFGIKTGTNDFFHLQRFEKQRTDGKVYVENRVGYKGLIEAKYLAPLIKSPSHIKGFVIPPSFLSSLWLFYCLDSPAQLQGSEAWTYIKWGENTRVTIKQGKKSGENIVGFSSVRSVKQRDYWYSIGSYPIPSLLWTKSYHDKSGCFHNQAKMLPDQRFYGIVVKQDKFLPLIFTYLNSSFIWAQMEAQGNTNMGFGVLDTNVYWLREIKIPVEAMVEKRQIMKLMDKLILEKNRVSMLDHSQIRYEIDRFYAKYLDVSNNSMKRLYKFISRSIRNRLQ